MGDFLERFFSQYKLNIICWLPNDYQKRAL